MACRFLFAPGTRFRSMSPALSSRRRKGLIDIDLGAEAGTHSSATDGTHLTDISGTYLSAMSGILLAIYSRKA